MACSLSLSLSLHLCALFERTTQQTFLIFCFCILDVYLSLLLSSFPLNVLVISRLNLLSLLATSSSDSQRVNEKAKEGARKPPKYDIKDVFPRWQSAQTGWLGLEVSASSSPSPSTIWLSFPRFSLWRDVVGSYAVSFLPSAPVSMDARVCHHGSVSVYSSSILCCNTAMLLPPPSQSA